jgi:hypothetical protein
MVQGPKRCGICSAVKSSRELFLHRNVHAPVLRAAFGTNAASQDMMKANFSTTGLIYYPGDFLLSMNVIWAICDNTKCGSRSAQRSWLTDGLTGVCA